MPSPARARPCLRADVHARLRFATVGRNAAPVTAARTLDQRAHAILHAYAAMVEKATDVVRDPHAPIAFKRALGRAERVATPAVETLEIAVAAYVRARGDFAAAAGDDQSSIERAKIALEVTTRRLGEAIDAAQAPIAELEGLIRARRA